ncbi:3-methyl-2-oxobutanoate hydroxymethyltransferase (plasmid) [Candidatus Photodesmus katoptron]|uniref:3-methyl-2-oxobutanoate hydroxymethyltransferase n=1 Tax=Candidatus Photodesmus katoptron Akat1 TaxID=1236703 RepID=S3DJ61_9GAMM|nr:3-methyl-2-oxobutanoate hydroxymethyltransferase [Candidatus Photodesmus katoptron]EPE37184.1 3-methyl-2-oxobutanoate hydroxymethyltransferase [Candidatus Photodesmus katoptron Akat1]KEY90056.1 3-methyl-2-oxobutanoate hydroxymethyltransferase [Candidatus Photodesmus katoptron]
MKIIDADFLKMKGSQSISMLTAYNYPIANRLEKAGVSAILVGDTVGVVEMGFPTTREVKIEHMEYHISAVRRGAKNTHIIGDLPYLSYSNADFALENAKRLLSAGADSIKLEGNKTEIISFLHKNNISVVGHIGLTPQTAKNFKQVGNTKEEAIKLINYSVEIQNAGAFMLILEHIPSQLAKKITKTISIPTIGIGAGKYCDGQVMVINDVLGLGEKWPPFSKQYDFLGNRIQKIAKKIIHDISFNKEIS